jgi:hypothetical protein
VRLSSYDASKVKLTNSRGRVSNSVTPEHKERGLSIRPRPTAVGPFSVFACDRIFRYEAYSRPDAMPLLSLSLSLTQVGFGFLCVVWMASGGVPTRHAWQAGVYHTPLSKWQNKYLFRLGTLVQPAAACNVCYVIMFAWTSNLSSHDMSGMTKVAPTSLFI